MPAKKRHWPVGRPTKYTPERARRIRDRFLDGQGLRSACKAEGVAASTFLNWVRKDHDGLWARYARIKACKALIIFEDCDSLLMSGTRKAMKEFRSQMLYAHRLIGNSMHPF